MFLSERDQQTALLRRFGWLWLACLVVGFAVIFFINPALAQDATDPFTQLQNQGTSFQTGANKLIGWVAWAAAFGVFAVAAFSKGKFPYPWAAAIAGGILFVTYIGSFVNWFQKTASASS